MNRRVPVVAQLPFFVIRQRLNAARLVRLAIDAPDIAALRFGVDVIRIGRIGEHPEAVAAINIFPTIVRDSTRIGRVANPGTVVLQAAVDVIWPIHVEADVIKLRDRQVVRFPPSIAAVE